MRLRGGIKKSAAAFSAALLSSAIAGCAYHTVLGSFDHTREVCEIHDRSDRCYYVVSPSTTEPNDPSALILMLHPALAPPGLTEWITGFAEEAVARGDVVIYPSGIGRSWNDGRGGRTTVAEWLDADDLGYISGAVKTVAADYPGRPLYIVGMSSGGMLAMRILCQSQESGFGGLEIAGAATVVSSLPGRLVQECEPQAYSDLLMIYGDDDWILPSSGGDIFFLDFLFGNILSRDETVEAFRKINGCEPDPITLRLNRNEDGSVRNQAFFDDCESQKFVEVMTLENAGHTWPGEPQWLAWLTWRGGVSDEVDATDYILDWMDASKARKQKKGVPE